MLSFLRYAENIVDLCRASKRSGCPDASVLCGSKKKFTLKTKCMMAGYSCRTFNKPQMKPEVIRPWKTEWRLAMEGKPYSDVRRLGIAEDVNERNSWSGGTRKFNHREIIYGRSCQENNSITIIPWRQNQIMVNNPMKKTLIYKNEVGYLSWASFFVTPILWWYFYINS